MAMRKAHTRRTKTGVAPVRAAVIKGRKPVVVGMSMSMNEMKPDPPRLHLEGDDAKAIVEDGTPIGQPVTVAARGTLESAAARKGYGSNKISHSATLCMDQIKLEKSGKKPDAVYE